ncbi:MAG: hypothetical protein WBF43_00105 [Methylocella sp.]
MLTPAQSRFDLDRCRLPRDLRLASIMCALAIAAGVAGAFGFNTIFVATAGRPSFVWLTTFFFRAQDAPWLLFIALMLLGFGILRLSATPRYAAAAMLRDPRAAIAILAALVFVCGIIGTHVVFHGFPLTRDEILAEFDAIILRSGMAIAPVAPEWQPFASALAPTFMLPIADGAGYVSAYLPVNAAFRALVGLVTDSAWTSPLLAALAVVTVYAVARRLWPARLDAALISALLVATSSQVLVASMTSYAMTGHLTLNLIWLWLFLRNDKIGHGAAIAVGFLASGLHQLIFHPLFAAPFIVRLWASGRRPLALAYIVAYAVICLFWISYWQIIIAWQGFSPQASSHVGSVYFIARAAFLFASFHWTGAGLMLKNALRFVDWQNPIVMPFALLAYRPVRNGDGIARELSAGLALTLAAMFILLPYQGHGWGYRYLHGLIGSLSLLAGYGWIALSERATRNEMAASWTMLAIGSAVAWLVLLPAHAKQAHDFVMPYARASDAIGHTATDLVVVDPSGLLFAGDLVRNDPFLRNRPKVLDLTLLDEAKLADLCARYSITMFGRRQGLAFGISPNDEQTRFDDDVRAKKKAAMARLSCGVDMAVGANKDTRF